MDIMQGLKKFLRESNFVCRVLTFGMIPLCLKLAILIGKWWIGTDPGSLKPFGIAGILIGAATGHFLYYYWLFPEKRKQSITEKK